MDGKERKLMRILKFIFVGLVFLGFIGYFGERKSPEEIKGEIEVLEQQVRKIPASDFIGNINAYKKLAKLDPNNQKYKDKLALYEAKEGSKCYSSYNHRHFELRDSIIANMRNPDSFEFVSGQVYKTEDDGNRFVDMTYRGQNGFGGMTIEKVRARVRNSDCAVLSVEQLK